MAEQVELLEHHANADDGAFLGQRPRRQRLAVLAKTHAAATDLDDAGVPAFEVVDAAEQRALARSAGAEQRHDFAEPDGQVDTGQHGLSGVGLVEPADVDHHFVMREAADRLVRSARDTLASLESRRSSGGVGALAIGSLATACSASGARYHGNRRAKRFSVAGPVEIERPLHE